MQHVPKQGRRAGFQSQNSSENLLEFAGDVEEKPLKTRKTGGWADEGNKLTKYLFPLLYSYFNLINYISEINLRRT